MRLANANLQACMTNAVTGVFPAHYQFDVRRTKASIRFRRIPTMFWHAALRKLSFLSEISISCKASWFTNVHLISQFDLLRATAIRGIKIEKLLQWTKRKQLRLCEFMRMYRGYRTVFSILSKLNTMGVLHKLSCAGCFKMTTRRRKRAERWR